LAPLLKSKQVTLSRHPLSLRVRLNAKILYPSGDATLTPAAQKLLREISDVLEKIPHNYPIVIQGYTNSKPIHNYDFRSNWELSTARAVSVVHLFIKNGFPGKQLSAQGFSKYHPLQSDDTAEGLKVNRRVEIVIKAPVAQRLQSRGRPHEVPGAVDAPPRGQLHEVPGAVDALPNDRAGTADAGTADAPNAGAGGAHGGR
jgi:chemotaxis protein MotB